MTEHYPFQSGNNWTYVNPSGGGVAGQQVVLTPGSGINGSTPISNNQVPATIKYFTNDGQGLRLHRIVDPNLGDFTFDPPIKFADAVPEVDTGPFLSTQNGTVTGTASVCSPSLTLTLSYTASERVLSEQAMTVNGRYYPDTVTIDNRLTISGTLPFACGGGSFSESDNALNTYARYVGPIKAEATGLSLELSGTNILVMLMETDVVDVDENAGTVTIPIRRLGYHGGASSVQCFTDPTGATATQDTDYSATNTLIEWTDLGVQNCTVPVINDSEHEETETFGISISNPVGPGGINTSAPGITDATVSILDDDPLIPSHDFTGDSRADVLVRNSSSGFWYLYHLNGRSVVSDADTGAITMNSSTTWQKAGVADFSGDGYADVLVRNTSTGQWYLYALNGRTILGGGATGGIPMAADLNWQPVAVADFTGDDKADVLLRHSSTGTWYLYALDGRSILGGGATGGIPMASSLDWQPVGVGDFTGDGKSDILLRNQTTGFWYLYALDGRMIAGGGQTGGVPLTQDLAWSVVATTDVTGDTKADVLMRHSSSGAWYLFPLVGRTVVSGVNLGGVPMVGDTAWQPRQVEDFTGDGKADVLLRNSTTRAWFLYVLNGRNLVGGASQGDVPMTSASAWQTQ
jgi:hypothetical protein